MANPRFLGVVLIATIAIGGRFAHRHSQEIEARERAAAEDAAQEAPPAPRAVPPAGPCRFPHDLPRPPKDGDTFSPSFHDEKWTYGAEVTTIRREFCSVPNSAKPPLGLPLDPQLPSDRKAERDCRAWLKSQAKVLGKTYKESSCSFIRMAPTFTQKIGPTDRPYYDPSCFRFYLAKVECYTPTDRQDPQ